MDVYGLVSSAYSWSLEEGYIPGGVIAQWFQDNQITWGEGGEDILWGDTGGNLPDFTVNGYGPSTDIAAGFRQNQIILGREGNDTLVGLDPVVDNPDQLQVDIFIGDEPTIPVPGVVRDFSNKFNLGDWRQPYYVNNGINDFAVVLDFNSGLDILQLHGSPLDYQLVQSSTGTEILWQQGDVTDRVALLPFTYDLSLEGSYFQFEGDTPPPGPAIEEAEQLGTDGFDLSITVATDPFGNVFIAGGTTRSLGGPNAGSRDPWLAKYDSEGNQLWTQQFGSSSFDTAYGAATDNLGNVYLVGYTEGDLAGPRQAEFSDVWLAKYDGDGNQLWTQQFGSDVINLSFDIEVDSDGNVYLSGTTVEEAAGRTLFPLTDDFFVTKYDTNGNQQWFTQFGSPIEPLSLLNFDESYGVAVSNEGNVYATGWTYGDLGGENAGVYDVWVSKQDNDGNLEWISQFGTEDLEFSWDIAVDSEGNSYATGWTLGDLGGESAGSYDAWLAKYDNCGNQVWIQQFGTAGDDQAFGVAVDSNDNIFVTGYTNDNLAATNAGAFDAWVARYDQAGNQIWIQQFGTQNVDQANAVTFDDAGSLYVTGATEGSFGDANAGSVDAWLVKLDAESGTLLSFAGTPDFSTGCSVIDVGCA